VADLSVKRLEELEFFPPAFYRAGAAVGASAFGINVLDLPAGWEDYPHHDHAEPRQEEVYVVVKGSGKLVVEGEEFDVEPITVARVGPETKRRWIPGENGLTLVAVGGVPGGVYQPRS
jgi:mannose-6-phosphate isomerase-like protein (cupin superfamily)